MTPATIIQRASEAGVQLALVPKGSLKATGESTAVNCWLAVIRRHKTEIIELLKRHGPPPNLYGYTIAEMHWYVTVGLFGIGLPIEEVEAEWHFYLSRPDLLELVARDRRNEENRRRLEPLPAGNHPAGC